MRSQGDDRVDDGVKVAVLVLALSSLFCCALAVARALYSGSGMFVFLGWNLLLAWVPLGLSLALARRHAPGRKPGRLGSLALGAVWLAFFPNAPYIVTDLMHLGARSPVPLWFDATMVFAFALTGICLAFSSLLFVHRLVWRRLGPVVGWLFVGAVSALTGFGIYLGRFQRWNSWDVLARPGELLADVAGRFVHPLAHPRTFGLTAMMGGLVAVAYAMLFALTLLGQSAGAAPRTEAEGAAVPSVPRRGNEPA